MKMVNFFVNILEDLLTVVFSGQYDVHILNGETQIETIKPVSAILSTDMTAITKLASQPLSIITTAVGPSKFLRLGCTYVAQSSDALSRHITSAGQAYRADNSHKNG